jgi:hypothetical protein
MQRTMLDLLLLLGLCNLITHCLSLHPPLPSFPQSSITLIFPGYGGLDANTQRIEDEIKTSDLHYKMQRFVCTYDWKQWRGNEFNAAFNGEKIGSKLGEQLSNLDLHDIHVIGISVGSFAANECTKRYMQKLEGGKRARIRLTLLDPFTARGFFSPIFGRKNFGRFADYCEVFLNTDDPVPFTNTPLDHAHNFDITQSASKAQFIPLPGDNMHSWPTAYFGLLWREKIDPRRLQSIFTPSHAKNPRGAVQLLP